MTRTIWGMAVALALATGFGASSAHALSFTFELDSEFSGGDSPTGGTPWATATFDDGDTAGSVLLTLSAVGLSDAESIAGFYFNLDPALNPDSLNIALQPGGGSTPNSIDTGVNAFKADGDGYFDILIDFPPPPGSTPERFTAGETVSFLITGISTLTAASFDFLSAGEGNSPDGLKTAAHIQRIGTGASGSGWITGDRSDTAVPEPASLLLLGTGLLALGLFVSRRRRS